MAGGTSVTVYVRQGDPVCEDVVRYLRERGVEHTVRDVLTDPSASAVLFGRLGRVTVPVTQVGEALVVGYDPVQLARLLPRPESDEERVALGAAVRTVTAETARQHGLPATYGVEVGRVVAGSPAEAAGLRAGDVITGIGAYTIQGGADQFRVAVAARRPGDVMPITVWRDGGPLELTVSFPRSLETAADG